MGDSFSVAAEHGARKLHRLASPCGTAIGDSSDLNAVRGLPTSVALIEPAGNSSVRGRRRGADRRMPGCAKNSLELWNRRPSWSLC
ncbi:hypothetical protein GCM10022222_55510 [Amycolatopsis ultiminotia]|uniref:Uncharacterized protein n=1 Tax=Amycolatopsis ultiminotia TaxID=543629 RepID=A0ABP6XDS1_9PSEU